MCSWMAPECLWGRKRPKDEPARTQENRPTRAKPSWDACSSKPNGTRKVTPFATRTRPPIPDRKETEGRAGKNAGEPAHTREAKLGCVFIQTKWDAEGYPIRDPDSTTYTGAIEPAEEFGKRLYLEAWNRGWSRAEKKVVIGDGAEWIWNIAQQHFPGAIQIVDIFHARQHVWDLARKLFPLDKAERARWITIEQDDLDKG